VRRKSGGTVNAARYLRNKRDAEMIAARMRRAVGR